MQALGGDRLGCAGSTSWVDELQVTDSGAGHRPAKLGWIDELGSTLWVDVLCVTY